MEIGQVIRKYRKDMNLTQEEIAILIREADERFKTQTYDAVFQWAKKKIHEYPGCYMLVWQLAVILDAQRMMKKVEDSEDYEAFILNCYERVLECPDEQTRNHAAGSLYTYYLRLENYEKAEEYLSYFSIENPERKRKLAEIYSMTGRTEEAYKAYEELIFSFYQILSMIFNSMSIMAMKAEDYETARMYADKQSELAKLFDMGAYYSASCYLELATLQKDKEWIMDLAEQMFQSIDDMTAFTQSPLYAHMTFFKPVDSGFEEELRKNLMFCFKNEPSYDFLKDEERWKKITEQ